MLVRYFIALQPASAGYVTCCSVLICSDTLLHLIRTGCVPPNNGIMIGAGCFLVLVLSASWTGARALEWESLLTQMWHSYECQSLLVLIGYPSPHGLQRSFELVGTLTVKCLFNFPFYEGSLHIHVLCSKLLTCQILYTAMMVSWKCDLAKKAKYIVSPCSLECQKCFLVWHKMTSFIWILQNQFYDAIILRIRLGYFYWRHKNNFFRFLGNERDR